MSDTAQAPEQGDTQAAVPKPERRRPSFRSAARGPKLSAPEARRQGEITHLAFKLLGGREEAIAFLNTFHDELDGRPLNIATASPEGFQRVETAIGTQAGSPVRS